MIKLEYSLVSDGGNKVNYCLCVHSEKLPDIEPDFNCCRSWIDLMQSYFWWQNFNSTSVEPHAKSEQHTTILRNTETSVVFAAR